jgi:hypothetical protein
MTNPVLRKLRSGKVGAAEIANLLAKHIGDGSNESHCQSAVEALSRIRDDGTRNFTELIRILQQSNGFPACEIITQVITGLRAAALRDSQRVDDQRAF